MARPPPSNYIRSAQGGCPRSRWRGDPCLGLSDTDSAREIYAKQIKAGAKLDKHQAVQMYEQMTLIRRFEERCERLYMEGKIKGFLHLYIGEEAVAVGTLSAAREDDYVITHYRDHGHALAKGLAPKAMMAELLGKAAGTSGGKGGSMHLFDVERRFMGGHAIVGGHLPIAVGLALAIKYRAGDDVVVCFFGDGAVNQGEFHESMNLASLWSLPVLFLLENNLYGMGTHVDRTHSGGRDIFQAADHYKIQAAQVDGMDVVAVHEAASEAIKRVRMGNGPVFLEAMTYRFRGHSVADPTAYRNSTEVDAWRTKDPIDKFKTFLLAKQLVEEEELDHLDSKTEEIVNEAVKFAECSDYPAPEALYANIYA